MADILQRSYGIDDAESARILGMPQRCPGWYRVRDGWVDAKDLIFRGTLVSSSVVGKILGHEGNFGPQDKYDDGTESFYSMLIRTQRGTASESPTQHEFAIVLQQHVGEKVQICTEEVGILVRPDMPYLAASIDSQLHFLDSKTCKHTIGGLEMKTRGTLDISLPKWIKQSYHDQLGISMFLYKLEKYWFVFHGNDCFSVELFEFDEAQWLENLQIVNKWYWTNYWPTLVLVHTGKLVFADDDIEGIHLIGDESKDAKAVFEWCKKNLLADHLATMEGSGPTKRRKLM